MYNIIVLFQLMSKTGFKKSIVGTAKKWFGGNPSKTSQVANTATTVVYVQSNRNKLLKLINYF